MIMYERRNKTPQSSARMSSARMSSSPLSKLPGSPTQETKDKASALEKEPLSPLSPPTASPSQETKDAVEKRQLAVEGARRAYENLKASPNAIGKILKTFEANLRKAEKAYEEAKGRKMDGGQS